MQGFLIAAAAAAVQRKNLFCVSKAIKYLFSTTTAKFEMTSTKDMQASFDTEKGYEGLDVCQAMKNLANADAVCFDVDSTVIQEEGIVRYILYYFSPRNLVVETDYPCMYKRELSKQKIQFLYLFFCTVYCFCSGCACCQPG
jgi:hypothetical protein